MSNKAQYTKNVRRTTATISTANTARDGSGSIVTAWTAPAAIDAESPGGSRIERISIAATATTTAGMIRIYISDDAAANTTANTHLYKEIPVTAVTPSGTVQTFEETVEAVTMPEWMPIILGPGETLRFSTNNANAFRVTVMGGDY